MLQSRAFRSVVPSLVTAMLAVGCSSGSGPGSGGLETTGSLSVALELGNAEIDEVAWEITGGDMEPMSDTIDTSAPGATASVEVFGLLPTTGDDYTITMAATTTDGETTCQGSADFGINVSEITAVMVFLNCKPPERLGGVRVNGKFNICAELQKVIVSPLQTSIGYDIDLSAQAADSDNDESEITYVWSADGDGTIDDPNAKVTTFTCEEAGDHNITILVTDNDVYCTMATWTVPVTCVDDGGNLCEGVTCEDDGNECTETECNPANGECETEPVDDGTECSEGTGQCMAGGCVDIDLCEGVDCDDENECTNDVCNPEDGSCSNDTVDDGTECNEGAGQCIGGTCMDIDPCEGVECEDTGNDCTTAACNTEIGECEEMDVPDGTECNGGAGSCSMGECIDDNLCDGVDCTSDNDCLQDGACDPADGECIPGDALPIDASCGDGGVCDGAGNCVECNDAGQCPDDGQECTIAACQANQCGQDSAMDGTVCDFVGGTDDGVCESGMCIAAPDCTTNEQCDDGNECTVNSCIEGSCQAIPEEDGADCDADGVPGTCQMGECAGICDSGVYIKASNTDSSDAFGAVVAISGDTMVVGAPLEDGDGSSESDNSVSRAGAAYVYEREGPTWNRTAYLKGEIGDDTFGASVAIDGDTIVVGAPNDDGPDDSTSSIGAAYVFERDGSAWVGTATLRSPSPFAGSDDGDFFGNSVAVEGNQVLVGAPGEVPEMGAFRSGVAHVFVQELGEWGHAATLIASNFGGGDAFGWSVALSGDTAVVGARAEDSPSAGINGDQSDPLFGPSAVGAVYVFRGSGSSWTQTDYVKASNPEGGDEFGWSVSIDGDTLAVSAPSENSAATGINGDEMNNSALSSGAVYVFERVGDVWSQVAYVKASNTGANDDFGGGFGEFGRPRAQSVSLSGDRLLVGARMEASPATGIDGDQGDGSGVAIGAAYLFERAGDSWSQIAYIKPACPPVGPGPVFFGESVALEGPTVVVGAGNETGSSSWPNADPTSCCAQSSGAVYVYTLP